MTLLLCRSEKFAMIAMLWCWNCMLPPMTMEKSLDVKGALPKLCGLFCGLVAHGKLVIPPWRSFREHYADVKANRMGHYRNSSGPFWCSRGTQSPFAYRHTESLRKT